MELRALRDDRGGVIRRPDDVVDVSITRQGLGYLKQMRSSAKPGADPPPIEIIEEGTTRRLFARHLASAVDKEAGILPRSSSSSFSSSAHSSRPLSEALPSWATNSVVVMAFVLACAAVMMLRRRLSRSVSSYQKDVSVSPSDLRARSFMATADKPDFVYVSCPYMQDVQKLDYQDRLTSRCAEHANEHNAIIDGAASKMAKSDDSNWTNVWNGVVWKVIQSIFMPGEITLVLVYGGGPGCQKERETIPKLVEFLQKSLYPAGKIAATIFGQLPKVSYKIVEFEDLIENGPEKAKCLRESIKEGDGIIGGDDGGGDWLEFDETAQAYVTEYLDLPDHNLTTDDVKSISELLKKDTKFVKAE